jgi:hypothetical protein
MMELQHCVQKGSEMPADYLSRNVVEALRISDEDFANHQNNDPFCQTVKHISNMNLPKVLAVLEKLILHKTKS